MHAHGCPLRLLKSNQATASEKGNFLPVSFICVTTSVFDIFTNALDRVRRGKRKEETCLSLTYKTTSIYPGSSCDSQLREDRNP